MSYYLKGILLDHLIPLADYEKFDVYGNNDFMVLSSTTINNLELLEVKGLH
jgi:hypothetical protein